ncbi:MAG: DUF4340 domain-containing protein [Proteobacteria bacterium]|nr:DUF4340 domain-containing protein [Pseudomonadota bacterium]
MSPKTFIIVAAAAVIAVLAAGLSLDRDRGYGLAAQTGERVFPELLDGVNDVQTMVIEQPDGVTITLEHAMAGWSMKDRAGYPARAVKVRRTIFALAKLAYREPKTRRKEKFAKLGLRDPSEKGAVSSQAKLFDGGGKLVADLIIGNSRIRKLGKTEGGIYFRLPGDEQTWLGTGDLDISADRPNWLERKIVNLPRDRVRRVVIRHADGQTLSLSRATPEAGDFTLDDMPQGKKLKNKSGPNGVGGALADLQLDDVGKDSAPFDAAATTTADFTTFDGLSVRTRVTRRNGEFWLRIEASGKEAEAITARTAGWVYRIPIDKGANLTKRLEDLIEDAKPKS